jgi:hypothetical protein
MSQVGFFMCNGMALRRQKRGDLIWLKATKLAMSLPGPLSHANVYQYVCLQMCIAGEAQLLVSMPLGDKNCAKLIAVSDTFPQTTARECLHAYSYPSQYACCAFKLLCLSGALSQAARAHGRYRASFRQPFLRFCSTTGNKHPTGVPCMKLRKRATPIHSAECYEPGPSGTRVSTLPRKQVRLECTCEGYHFMQP